MAITTISITNPAASLIKPVSAAFGVTTEANGTQVATIADTANVTVTGASGSIYAGVTRTFDPVLLASGPVNIGLLAPTPVGPYTVGQKITFDVGLWAHNPDLGLVTFTSIITLVSTGAILGNDLVLALPFTTGTIRQTVTATQGVNSVVATRDTVL